MADNEDVVEKKLKDYSAKVAEDVPRVQHSVRVDPSRLQAALDELMALEKRTRLAGDVDSSLVVVKALLQLIRDTPPVNWALVGEYIGVLCKKRAQMQKVMYHAIKQGAEWVDETGADEKAKRGLIEAVRAVSEGKMFVEMERARLTRLLSGMEEAAGRVAEACALMQEVQVETIGSMSMRDKADFLLEQVRLCLANQDHLRAEIVARKVNQKVLDEADMQDLKIKFNTLMAGYNRLKERHLDACRNYLAIYSTPRVQEDEAQWRPALRAAAMFLALSMHDAEVVALQHRLLADKRVQREAPQVRGVLEILTTSELAPWPLPCDADWRSDPVFADADVGARRYETLRRRVVQHNIRIVAGAFRRIRLRRLAELLALQPDEAEDFVAELVSAGQLHAKIDRPAGVVTFAPRKDANTVINDWSRNIGSLLALVEKTCHMINKETMLHAAAAATSSSSSSSSAPAAAATAAAGGAK